MKNLALIGIALVSMIFLVGCTNSTGQAIMDYAKEQGVTCLDICEIQPHPTGEGFTWNITGETPDCTCGYYFNDTTGEVPVENEINEVKVILLTDERCGQNCDVSSLLDSLKTQVFSNSNLTIEEVDYSSDKGKELYDTNGLTVLPALLFEKSVKDAEGYNQISNYMETKGDYLSLRVGASYDPNNPEEPYVCSNCEEDKVGVDMYVMSQCPYAKMVEDTFVKVKEKFGDAINWNVYFIGNDNGDGTFSSLHGGSEVDEDMKQVCIMKYYPEEYYSYLKYGTISSDIEPINSCINGEEGKQLLIESFQKSKDNDIGGSPTVYINGELYDGDRSESDFTEKICEFLPNNKVCGGTEDTSVIYEEGSNIITISNTDSGNLNNSTTSGENNAVNTCSTNETICNSDTQCNDGDSSTNDLCVNAGSCDSYCENIKKPLPYELKNIKSEVEWFDSYNAKVTIYVDIKKNINSIEWENLYLVINKPNTVNQAYLTQNLILNYDETTGLYKTTIDFSEGTTQGEYSIIKLYIQYRENDGSNIGKSIDYYGTNIQAIDVYTYEAGPSKMEIYTWGGFTSFGEENVIFTYDGINPELRLCPIIVNEEQYNFDFPIANALINEDYLYVLSDTSITPSKLVKVNLLDGTQETIPNPTSAYRVTAMDIIDDDLILDIWTNVGSHGLVVYDKNTFNSKTELGLGGYGGWAYDSFNIYNNDMFVTDEYLVIRSTVLNKGDYSEMYHGFSDGILKGDIFYNEGYWGNTYHFTSRSMSYCTSTSCDLHNGIIMEYEGDKNGLLEYISNNNLMDDYLLANNIININGIYLKVDNNNLFFYENPLYKFNGEDPQYICIKSNIHSDEITSINVYDDKVITASKDGSVVIFTISI